MDTILLGVTGVLVDSMEVLEMIMGSITSFCSISPVDKPSVVVGVQSLNIATHEY